MTTPKAIIIVGALIALAIVITNHWQMVGIPTGVFRMDRWTGTIFHCTNTPAGEFTCP
jgi:hypothetical protein